MSGIGFNTGLKALLGSQVGLDTVGHNIANVGVNGYSQQNVNYGTSQALNVRGLMIGSGVNATSIQRSFDNVLEGRIQSRLGIGGSFEARMVAFEQIESVFAEPNGFSLAPRWTTSLAACPTCPHLPMMGCCGRAWRKQRWT